MSKNLSEQETDSYIATNDNKSTEYLEHYSVIAIIPAYNEATSIGKIVRATRPYVNEVIVIDDCSSDLTGEIARSEGSHVIRHIFNTGIGGSLRTGYIYCLMKKCNFVVQLDADGQHDPKFIPMLVNESLKRDYCVVTGSRFLNQSYKDYSFVRRIGIKFFSGLVRIVSSSEITDITSGYRVYRMDCLEQLKNIDDKHWAVEQTLRTLKLGMRYGELSVAMPVRKTGHSQFNMSTFLWYPITMVRVILKALITRGENRQ